MRTTRLSASRLVVAVSISVGLFWIAAFAFGWASPVRGMARLRAAFGSGAAAKPFAEAAPFPWRYADTLPSASLGHLRTAAGDFRFLLVVRVGSDPTTPSTENFLRNLGERHRNDRLVTMTLTDSAPSLVLDVLGMRELDGGTVLLDSVGRVRFAWPGIPRPDHLRQLAERAVWGRARNEPPVLPMDPSVWASRLRQGDLDRLRGGPVDVGTLIANYQYAVVFDAHCSRCRILRHLEDLVAIADSLTLHGVARIAAIIPQHYLGAVTLARLDSIPVDWFVAKRTVAPELAIVTRDIPEASPLLLELDPRHTVRAVVQVARIGRP